MAAVGLPLLTVGADAVPRLALADDRPPAVPRPHRGRRRPRRGAWSAPSRPSPRRCWPTGSSSRPTAHVHHRRPRERRRAPGRSWPSPSRSASTSTGTAARSREARRARTEAEALARTTAALLGEQDPVPAAASTRSARLVLPRRRVAAQPSRRRAGRCWRPAASAVPSHPFDGVTWDLRRRPRDAARRARRAAEQRRPAGAADVRVAAGAGPREPAVAGRGGRGRLAWPTPMPCAPRSSRRSPTTCGHRWRRSRPRPRACCRTTWPGATRSAPSSSATIDAESDRLNALVGNLLDMSRLQAGAVEVVNRPVFLEDVVANAMASLACGQDPRIEVAVPETVPPVAGRPGAARAGGGQRRVERRRLVARRSSDPRRGRRGGRRRPPAGRRSGPGAAAEELRERVFEPFQRFGDRSNEAGVGPRARRRPRLRAGRWAAASCSTTRPAAA